MCNLLGFHKQTNKKQFFDAIKRDKRILTAIFKNEIEDIYVRRGWTSDVQLMAISDRTSGRNGMKDYGGRQNN